MIIDKNTSAVEHCYFCFTRPKLISSNSVSVAYTPSQIIPFEISIEFAREKFLLECDKVKNLLSFSKSKKEKLSKEIKGVYLSYWLFDVSCKAEISTNNPETLEVFRNVEIDCQKIPINACKKLEELTSIKMDGLEPFNYEELRDFDITDLSDFNTITSDYTDTELLPQIEKQVSFYIEDYCLTNFNATILNNVRIIQHNAVYTLIPVYLYVYNTAFFIMNGQTGKIICNNLQSWKRVLILWFGIGIIAFRLISSIYLS